jgi:hypothetical protein
LNLDQSKYDLRDSNIKKENKETCCVMDLPFVEFGPVLLKFKGISTSKYK